MKGLQSLKIAFLTFLLPVVTMAQRPMEIVVTVSDTIHIVADRYISIIEYSDPSIFQPSNENVGATSKTISSEELEKLIEESKGIPEEGAEQSFFSSRQVKQVTVKFDAFNIQKSLTEQLMKFKNIKTNHLPPTSSITTTNSRLIQKLIEAARTKAKLLAQELDRTLGVLIEVEELSYGKGSGGWTAYPPLSLQPSDRIPTEKDKAVISAKYKFHFEAE